MWRRRQCYTLNVNGIKSPANAGKYYRFVSTISEIVLQIAKVIVRGSFAWLRAKSRSNKTHTRNHNDECNVCVELHTKGKWKEMNLYLIATADADISTSIEWRSEAKWSHAIHKIDQLNGYCSCSGLSKTLSSAWCCLTIPTCYLFIQWRNAVHYSF